MASLTRKSAPMMRFELRKTGDVYRVAGHLNEDTDFSPLLAATESPLKVSLEGVTAVSSVGTKALAMLIRELGSRDLQLIEVPTFVVELFNVVPAVLGKRARSVQSLYVAYQCAKCAKSADLLVQRDEVKMTNRGIVAPQRSCERCRTPLKPKGQEEDVFLFLTYA